MEEQLRFMDQIATAAVDMGIRFGPKLLVAVLILAAGLLAGRWAGRVLGRTLVQIPLEPPVRPLIERIHIERPDDMVVVVADKAAKSGMLGKVMDEVKAGGIKDVAIGAAGPAGK